MNPRARRWRGGILLGLTLAGLVFGLRGWSDDALKAVQFVFSDIDGRTVRLTDYRGKWVLVSFWAPWCPLCKVQIPTLNTLNSRPDFRVIGIALEYAGGDDAVRAAVRDNRMRFAAQVVGGSRREPNSAFRQVGPVDFFPTSYLYDPTGEIVMFIPGQVRQGGILGFMQRWQAEASGRAGFSADVERLAGFLRQRYGERGDRAYADWKALLDRAVREPPQRKLARVNDFFNQRIRLSDGRADYWATPGEVLGSGRGSAIELAVAKYFTLLALNLPAESLRLVYVQRQGEPVGTKRMVLAWYAASDREPLLLDAGGELQAAAKRSDLRPIYSFNSLGVWDETAQAVAAGHGSRLAIWEDTLRRARAEGFE